MATHFPPRANAALRPATSSAATSSTRAGGRADALAGAGENDDNTPGPRQPADSERGRLLELTHIDPQDEQPHFDIRGTAVGSSANDVIVNMRDDHIEVRINVPDPRLLEGLDSHMFTQLMNMLGIVDIAHLSEVSRATHTLMLKVPVAQLQQQRWTQLQQQWAGNHQQMIAPLQSDLAALHRRAFCNRAYHSIPLLVAFLALTAFAAGIWAIASCDLAHCEQGGLYRGTGAGGVVGGACVTIYCIIRYIDESDIRSNDRDRFRTAQDTKSAEIGVAQTRFIQYQQSGLPYMRQEPMPERFNVPTRFNEPDPESMLADAVAGSDVSSSSSSSSGAASSSSEPARPPPLSRAQQRENMALIVSRHQIWQVLTQAGYEIPFNPDVAYPYDRSNPTASTDPQINALFNDEDAMPLVAEELSLNPDVPEPSASWPWSGLLQPLSNVTAAVENWAFGSSGNSSEPDPEPERKQPSPSLASTISGPSSSSISSAGSGSGWKLRTDLENRRKLIVELLQRQGYPAEYEVGRAYPGDGTRAVPLDADFLSYGELFSEPEAIAAIRTHVTQAGARRQPAAVRVADDGLPIATSVQHASQLQDQGYEVKFHLPEDDKSWGQLKPRDPEDLD
jgi:hypothetical protein